MGAANVHGFMQDCCKPILRERDVHNKDPGRGTVDTEAFEEWVRDYLCPLLGKYALDEDNSVVFMNNIITHHDDKIKKLILATGAKLIYTARYSPDLNPIEYFFHIYKSALKRLSRLAA